MEAKTLHPFGLSHLIGLKNLIIGNAIFSLGRLANNIISFNKIAWIVTERKTLWHTSMLCQIFNMGNIIQINNSSQLNGLLELICRSIIRGQHNILPSNASGLGQQKLWQRAAICTSSFLGQKLNQARIRGSFNRKMLLEARCPAKGLLQLADIVANCLFIINMERSWILGNNLL